MWLSWVHSGVESLTKLQKRCQLGLQSSQSLGGSTSSLTYAALAGFRYFLTVGQCHQFFPIWISPWGNMQYGNILPPA